jgi:hypothetical protein
VGSGVEQFLSDRFLLSLDQDEDEDEVIRLGAKHAIARYHVVDRSPLDRAITCYCGWHGHEDLFGAHRRKAGRNAGSGGVYERSVRRKVVQLDEGAE